MPDLADLLLKAVRLLPPEEQDEVVLALFQQAVSSGPDDPAWRSPAIRQPGLAERVLGAAGARASRPATPLMLGPVWPERPGGPWQMVPVRLGETQHERLKQWCAEHGFSMAVVIRGLVERFLHGQQPPPGGDADPPPSTT